MIDCKGFRKKRSWHDRGIIPESSWKDGGKPRKHTSRGGAPAGIRTEYLPHKCLAICTIPQWYCIGREVFLQLKKRAFPQFYVCTYSGQNYLCAGNNTNSYVECICTEIVSQSASSMTTAPRTEPAWQMWASCVSGQTTQHQRTSHTQYIQRISVCLPETYK